MTGHCDADVLAEFSEGLLGRRRSARIRAHLAGCSRCASLSSELAEVRALLASAPVPRMPDELMARLDSVLTAESAAREQAGTVGAAAASTGAAGWTGRRRGGRPRPGRSARPVRPWRATALRAASVTAVVLVVAGGGYGVSRLLQAGPGGTSSSAAGGARNLQHAPVHGGRAHGNTGSLPNIVPSAGGLPVIQTRTDYLPGRLPGQVATLLASHPPGIAGISPAPAVTPALRGCVNLVTGGARPRLVDMAYYQGRPATVIVLAAAGGRPGQVWVVRPRCSAGSRDVITHALLTGTG